MYYASCPVGQVEIQNYRHSYIGLFAQVNLGDGQVNFHNHLSGRTNGL